MSELEKALKDKEDMKAKALQLMQRCKALEATRVSNEELIKSLQERTAGAAPGSPDTTQKELERYKQALDKAVAKLKSQQKMLDDSQKKCESLSSENEELKSKTNDGEEEADEFSMKASLQELKESGKRASYMDSDGLKAEETIARFNVLLGEKDEELAKLTAEVAKRGKELETAQTKIEQFNSIIKAKTSEVTELAQNMKAFEEVSNKKTEQLLQVQDDYNTLMSKFESAQNEQAKFKAGEAGASDPIKALNKQQQKPRLFFWMR